MCRDGFELVRAALGRSGLSVTEKEGSSGLGELESVDCSGKEVGEENPHHARYPF